jgi:hypothetical protein
VLTGNKDRLLLIILHGLVGEIEVEGESLSGAMPTWAQRSQIVMLPQSRRMCEARGATRPRQYRRQR